MPQLHRFEGREPAEVRARVLAELGPNACIVRAGRERSGGLFGFFEREVFIIEAEADEMPPRPPAPASRPAPAGRFEAQSPTTDLAEAIERLASSTDDVVALASSAQPSHSQLAHSPLDGKSTARPGHDSRAGDDARQRHGHKGQAPASVGPHPSDDRRGQDRPERESAQGEVASDGFGDLLAEAEAALLEASVPGREQRAPDRAHQAPHAAARATAQAVPDWLEGIGLPTRFRPSREGPRAGDLELGLVQALRALPDPPTISSAPGTAILAAGIGEAASLLGRAVAACLGIAEEELVVLTSAAAGRSRARRDTGAARCTSALKVATTIAQRRIDGRVSVVCAELAALDGGLTQLRDVVAAVRFDHRLAALPATAGSDVLEALERALGGLDALALYDLAASPEPGRWLAEPLPIAYLDWREASALQWAARLVEARPSSSASRRRPAAMPLEATHPAPTRHHDDA